jgi:hypothetical protein
MYRKEPPEPTERSCPDFSRNRLCWRGARRTLALGGALAVAALAFTLAAAAGTSRETCDPQEFRPNDPTLIRAEWVAPGRLRIKAGAVEGLVVTIRGRVNFGPFHHEWLAGSLLLEVGEVRVLNLAVPAEAFLHPLASTYVADLLVRVEPTDGEGRPLQEVALDNLFVAWLEGPGSAPTLWNEESMPPHGVLDPRLQQAAARVAPNARLGPPIAHLLKGRRAIEETTTGEDTPLSEQLPADPNDEETTP